MSKRIDQVVYYCDNCGTCCVPEGTEVVDVTAISTTDFSLKIFPVLRRSMTTLGNIMR